MLEKILKSRIENGNNRKSVKSQFSDKNDLYIHFILYIHIHKMG